MRCLLRLICIGALAAVVSGCGGGKETGAANPSPAAPSSGLGKVAYSLDSEIYVKALPDGEPHRVTQGRAPRWSPSGEWLLLARGTGYWVVREDGSGGRAIPGAHAIWAIGMDRLAYWSGNVGVVVEDADGSSRKELAATEGEVWGLAWSPDGARLAYDQLVEVPLSGYYQDGEGGKRFPINRRASLWVVDVDERTRPVELYSSTRDGVVVAGWSADSQYVLFWLDPMFANSATNDGLPLYSVPASGGEPRELTFSLLAGVWEPAPSGGATIVMTEGASGFTFTYQRVALADVATGQVTYLTGEDTASQQPDWSPDGRQIAFASQPDKGMVGGDGNELTKLCVDRRIWVMNADGDDKRQLTDDPQYRDERPLWSKDGSHILFVRPDGEMRASLWLVPAAGGEPQQVVTLQDVEPDGGRSIGWDSIFDWWRGP